MRRGFIPTALEGITAVDQSQNNTRPQASVQASAHHGPSHERGRISGLPIASVVVSDKGDHVTLKGQYKLSASGVRDLLNSVAVPARDEGMRLLRASQNIGHLLDLSAGSGIGSGITKKGTETGEADQVFVFEELPTTSTGGTMVVRHIDELNLEDRLLLGRGSGGAAFKISHQPSGNQICVKELKFDNARFRKEVQHELQALRKTRHHAIIDFYGAFFNANEGTILVAMELMDTSLHSLMLRRRILSEPEARAIAVPIVQGLLFLHKEKCVMHRDIKPGNILVNFRNGTVKIADFGISRHFSSPSVDAESDPMSESFEGSMAYMSPERLRGDAYSYNGDIWSLGVIICELLTGYHPLLLATEAGSEANASEAYQLDYWAMAGGLAQLPETFQDNPTLKVLERVSHFSEAHPEIPSLRVSSATEARHVTREATVYQAHAPPSTDRPAVLVRSELISPDAQDFIAFCLALDRLDRATVQDLAEHPWINGAPPTDERRATISGLLS